MFFKKIPFLVILVAPLFLSGCDASQLGELALPTSLPTPSPVSQNQIKLLHKKVGTNSFSYVVLRKEQLAKLGFYHLDSEGTGYKTISRLKNSLAESGKKLLFATNGGIFSPEFAPLGLYIENGKQLSPLNTKNSGGNFNMQPNGIFMITKTANAYVVARDEYKSSDTIRFALQSGPMLVIDGALNSQFTKGSENVTARSGVGVNSNGEVVFVVSDNLVNFYDFATFFRDQVNCSNALFLDGTISEMYVSGEQELTGQFFGAIIGLVE